jgi:hypothetical protein
VANLAYSGVGDKGVGDNTRHAGLAASLPSSYICGLEQGVCLYMDIIYTNVYTHTQWILYTQMCIHTHTNTYVYTCIHTHTHIHTYTHTTKALTFQNICRCTEFVFVRAYLYKDIHILIFENHCRFTEFVCPGTSTTRNSANLCTTYTTSANSECS